jgi:hypothetical protein
MKNIVLAVLGLISTAWATETVNIHERVNNAQAPAHQMQSARLLSPSRGLLLVWPVWASMNRPLLPMKP